jgi:hypothetical protein
MDRASNDLRSVGGKAVTTITGLQAAAKKAAQAGSPSGEVYRTK